MPRLLAVSALLAVTTPALRAGAQESAEREADALRAEAQDILSDRAYAEAEPSILERLFDWLVDLFDLSPSTGGLTAPETIGSGWAALRTGLAITAILALVAWATHVVIRQRTAIRTGEHVPSRSDGRHSPLELERRAAEATKRGDHGTALRLRFEAGLIRLERKGTLAHHESQPSSEVAGTLQLSEFDQLASTFDAVVYGGRAASAEDDSTSIRTWPVVVDKAPTPEKP